ncbi:MAG: sigma-70 family RNA polymerase sigma factor [Ferruginibacter sp.]
MTDADIIAGIKNFDMEAGNTLYISHKGYCLRFMNKMYADEETNKDIYQDAVIVFIEKVRGNKLTLENTSIQTYLNSICRNQVLVRLKQKNKPVATSDDWEKDYSDNYTDWFDEQATVKTERINVIMEELERMKTLGQVCYELLRKAFFENKTMETIATLMNYTNADNAKNQSYRCRERLKKQVFERLKK